MEILPNVMDESKFVDGSQVEVPPTDRVVAAPTIVEASG